MRKIGKEEIYAIAECALFAVGAIFLALVLILPGNPVWPLWIGIGIALVGIILWLRPLWIKIWKKFLPAPVPTTTEKLLDDDTPEYYELHRSAPTSVNFDLTAKPVTNKSEKNQEKDPQASSAQPDAPAKPTTPETTNPDATDQPIPSATANENTKRTPTKK